MREFCFEWATPEVKFSFLVRWRNIYTRGRFVLPLGVMADSRASSSKMNPSNTSRSSQSEARKEYDRKRNASRVSLFEAFEKWREFQDKHGLKTDKDVAEFLLENFVVKKTLWYA